MDLCSHEQRHTTRAGMVPTHSSVAAIQQHAAAENTADTTTAATVAKNDRYDTTPVLDRTAKANTGTVPLKPDDVRYSTFCTTVLFLLIFWRTKATARKVSKSISGSALIVVTGTIQPGRDKSRKVKLCKQ